jgi:hypothetical protein
MNRSPTPEQQYKAVLKEFGEAANAKWLARTDEEHRQAAARIEPLPGGQASIRAGGPMPSA